MSNYMLYRESLREVLAAQPENEASNTQAVWAVFMPEMAFDCPEAIQRIQEELVKPAHLKECILRHGDLGLKQYADHWGENPTHIYLTQKTEVQNHFKKLFTGIYLDLDRENAEANIDLYAGKLAKNLILVRQAALTEAIKQKVTELIEEPQSGARAELVRHFYLKDPIERNRIFIEQIAPLYVAEYLKMNAGLHDLNQIHDFFKTHQIAKSSSLACEIKRLITNRNHSDIINNDNSTNLEFKIPSISEVIASNLGKQSLNQILEIVNKSVSQSGKEQKEENFREQIINQAKERIRDLGKNENLRFEPIVTLIKSLKLNQNEENEITKEVQPILAKYLISILLDNQSAALLGGRIIRDEENSLVKGLAKLTKIIIALNNPASLIQDPQIQRLYLRIKEQAEGSAETQLIKLLDRAFGISF